MADPVWMVVMFDMPTLTAEQRKNANAFRNILLDMGCSRVQLSVYARFFPNASQSDRVMRMVAASVPPGGAVRILRMSDSVWSSAKRYEGPPERPADSKPDQLLLFE